MWWCRCPRPRQVRKTRCGPPAASRCTCWSACCARGSPGAHCCRADSVPAVEGLQFADQRARHLAAVAVEHARVVLVEQRILDAGEPGALAALDDDGVLRIGHVE